jgi:LysM repeat protein
MNAKPLFVLLVFILLIILFASQSIGSTDLTPDTPPASLSGGSSGNNAIQGVSSSKCGPSYTVESGDTLSRIALACGVTVQEILAQNPSITNPNLIRPGQVLNMYVAPTVNPTATQPRVSPIQSAETTTGLRPGGVVAVDIAGFPALSMVSVTIGPVGGKMEKVKEVQVDKNGAYHSNIGIPPTAKVGEKWVIISTSVSNPALSVTSTPFEIVK